MTSPTHRWATGTTMASLGPEAARELLALGTLREFAPSAALVMVGDPGHDVFVLAGGYVKVLGETADGRSVLIAVRVAGELVGELAALGGAARSASVLAATRVTAYSIARQRFLDHLVDRPETAARVHAGLAGKLRDATRHRIDVTSTSIPLRLALVLSYLAESFGTPTPGGVRVDVPLSQSELATLVGASEPTVRRALRVLKSRGLVSTDYRHPVVNDPAALRAYADEPAIRDPRT
jgi:CRP-like cAMP-binding protein